MDVGERAVMALNMARERHTHALDDNEVDLAYSAAAEAVMWACAADEYYRKTDATYLTTRDREPDGKRLVGLRLARNAQLHELVDTTEFEKGLRLPAFLPAHLAGYVWKPYDQLPAFDVRQRPDVVAAWKSELVGEQVEQTLRRVNGVLKGYLAGRSSTTI